MKLNALFSSHMVIQRDEPFVIWGEGKEGEQIQVSVQDKTMVTTVKDGSWQVTFPPMEAQLGVIITVKGDIDTVVIEDVAVGEVFVAGGQSNMEFYMRYDAEYKEAVKDCENINIRFFDCPEVSYPKQEQDFDYSRMGFWRECDPQNLEYYSAVAYYCARSLQKHLQVPVGMIGCNWGGTIASAWMSEEYVKKHGQIWLDEYLQATKDLDIDAYKKKYRENPMNDRGNPFADPFGELMLKGISREEQLKWMESAPPMDDDFFKPGPFHPNKPGNLYENMLKKIAPYPVRGVLWYQGESDEAHADIYKDVLGDMIDCWRNLWNRELPFFSVQLAPFGAWLESTGDKFPLLREQQQRLADEKNGVYLISSSDVGMQHDIHPKKKCPLGERMALSIRKYIFGENICCEAPRGEKVTWDAEGIKISFSHAAGGLKVIGEEVQAVHVYGISDKEETIISEETYQCLVQGEQVCIKLNETAKYDTIRVKFAKTPYYEVNLYNQSGIPAVPFELAVSR